MPEHLTIIPKPKITKFKAGHFTLTPGSTISCPAEGAQAGRLLERLTGLPVSSGAPGGICLDVDNRAGGAEGYRLDIDEEGIRITARTGEGMFYGAQTLRQMLPARIEAHGLRASVELPCVHIEDEPRFQHRGFMLDVSRHFFGVGEIKRIIELLALQKINRFHWHLTDDQGWRIEIKKYPRLTETGSQRKESQVGGWLLSRPVYDDVPHGGFYTQEEVREIVAFAKEHFIEVIPEIDAPGHSTAAIAGYPELQCSGGAVEVRSSVTSFSDPMCVGSEFVFEFLANVFAEMKDLFPFRHIHIGGDEVNKKAWKHCPACQGRMAQEALEGVHGLQAYFANRLVRILKSAGFKVICWNELMNDSLDEAVINQFWSPFGKKKTLEELRKGRTTIVSEFSYLYLDYSYELMPLVKTYTFEPHFDQLSDEQAAAILGVEGALWTEWVRSRQRLDWQMFPRLLAVSETGWTPREGKDFRDFTARVEIFEERLKALGVGHASRACYQQPRRLAFIPDMLRLVLSLEPPALKEYRKYSG